MNLEAIQNGFAAELDLLGFDIAYPNVEFKPSSGPYIRVNYLNAASEQESYGCDRLPSILQVDVVYREGLGSVKPAVIADTVAQAFPRNKIIVNSGVNIRIDSAPYAGNALNDNEGWFFIPVSIPYEVYV